MTLVYKCQLSIQQLKAFCCHRYYYSNMVMYIHMNLLIYIYLTFLKDMQPRPRDSSLLRLQSIHRSTKIWRVCGGDSQRCRGRNPDQTCLPALHYRILPLLQFTRFQDIAWVSSLQLDLGLITALVER